MSKYRIIAACLTLLTVLPLCSCEEFDFGAASSGSSQTGKSDAVSTLQEKIEQLQENWTYQEKEAEIQSAIDEMLLTVDEAYAKMERANAVYYAAWSDPDLQAAYQQAAEDYQIIYQMVSWAFANGYKKSMYASVFEPYIEDDGTLNFYVMNTLSRIIRYARQDAAEYDALLEDYYDTAYSDEIDIDETNLRCAQLYLDTLATYDVSLSLYDLYARDYTAEEISALYPEILDRVVPIKKQIEEKLDSLKEQYYDTYDEDAFELLEEYAPKLCPEIAESSEKLFGENLYVKASGTDCYDGGFTVNFPNENSGLIYLYTDDTIYDLMGLVHEFGHFHAQWRDSTPIYLHSNDKDIAEAQSQGMEMLFLSYYPEILGDSSDYYELLSLYNILDSISAGFAVGEFEYEVMQRFDSITAEEVVALYEQKKEEASLDLDLYQITHLYEQPGYYVSYGVSALPAVQIYTMMQEDRQATLETYEKLSEISVSDAELSFLAAMNECGLIHSLDTDSVDSLMNDLQNCVDKF